MKKVKIYTTPTCPYCALLKSFLRNQGVEYEELDVSVDEKAREEMIKKSGQMGVPVVDIEGEIIVGFNQEALSRALGL